MNHAKAKEVVKIIICIAVLFVSIAIIAVYVIKENNEKDLNKVSIIDDYTCIRKTNENSSYQYRLELYYSIIITNYQYDFNSSNISLKILESNNLKIQELKPISDFNLYQSIKKRKKSGCYQFIGCSAFEISLESNITEKNLHVKFNITCNNVTTKHEKDIQVKEI